MTHTKKASPRRLLAAPQTLFFSALRERFRQGYTSADLRADLLSGLVVGLVAIPLGMALAIASGVPPQNGLYTVIVAGALVALLGGSRCQVTGPTAAFVVILAPISARYGLGGLCLAGLMAGVILVVMGLARLGRLIEFIPYPVTTGFTSGIAVVIATLQLKDFFGLQVTGNPESFAERVHALVSAAPSAQASEAGIGLVTLAVLLLWPRITRRIPGPLVALGVGALSAVLLEKLVPGQAVATIGSRFPPGIPQTTPTLSLPWALPGPGGAPLVPSFGLLRELLPHAFAIAMLGAIESLLSAVVADGMGHTRHDPDAELVALGIGNIACPFLGGIPATGALARTATNIRFGARSPLAALTHAAFTLLAVLFLAPWLSHLPMASLAALLLLVAYNMSEIRHFTHIVKVAPRADVGVLLLCFFLTVAFDMVIGVTVGVVMASLLFMKRMAEMTSVHSLVGAYHPELTHPLPPSILLYEIGGPLFFGAADRAMGAMASITPEVKTVILDLEDVPVMDATGLVALESAVTRLAAGNKRVYFASVQAQPAKLLRKAGLMGEKSAIRSFSSTEEAIRAALSES